MEYPKLRQVEALAAQDNLICLRDLQGFSNKLLFVPQDIFFICTLFDGKHSIIDIQAEYTRKFGNLLFSDKVREIIDKLDGALFMESNRFSEAKNTAIKDFKNSPIRPASHSGTAYESKTDSLVKQIEGLFSSPDGPGLPDLQKSPSGRLRALIAPHIDLRRGGACFAWSYAELARECGAKTFVILGISHTETHRRFVLTAKDFKTPLGNLPADRDFIAKISENCRYDFFTDEFAHRNEHSIEFQVLFLQYLFRSRSDIKIVPILCSSFHQLIYSGDSPENDDEIKSFINALETAVREYGSEVCCIAGVDLSHVGRRFGQNLSISPAFIKQMEAEDNKMLKPVLDRDAEDFFQLIQEEKDRRNICGVPAIYTLLKLLGPLKPLNSGSSKLLKYDQAVDYNTQSIVSFAGAAFYE